jgi:hypothetical protein
LVVGLIGIGQRPPRPKIISLILLQSQEEKMFYNVTVRKKDSTTSASNGSDHNNGDCKKTKEKINYKARLEHKQYLVR